MRTSAPARDLWRPDIDDDATRRRFLQLIGAAGLLAGCADDEGEPIARSTATPTTRAGESVVDDRGEVVNLGLRPERIVAVYDGLDVQNLLACGVTPISHGSGTLPTPWLAGRLEGSQYISADTEVNLEAIAAMRPDLIVSSYYDDATYSALSRISPLYVVPRRLDWRSQLREVGRLLGRTEEAAASERKADDAISAARIALAGRHGERLAVMFTSDKDSSVLHLSTRRDGVGLVLEQIGFAPLPEPTDSEEEAFNTISAELAGSITGDRLLILDFDFDETGPSATNAEFLASPLGRLIPAAEGGIVYLSKTATNASHLDTALSVPFLAEELARVLA